MTIITSNTDLYLCSLSEIKLLKEEFKVKKLDTRDNDGRQEFSVTHGCGHQMTIGASQNTINSFMRDMIMLEFEYCIDCLPE